MIVVLVMLVIIALTSTAAIRNTTSGERLTNNLRATNVAQQYAEAALRFCESELAKPDGARTVANLKNANLGAAMPYDAATGVNSSDGVWRTTQVWLRTRTTPPYVVEVPLAQIVSDKSGASAGSESSSFKPATPPECLAEIREVPNGKAYLITARGFSPDYRRNTTTGETTQGSVVWLQSNLLTANL